MWGEKEATRQLQNHQWYPLQSIKGWFEDSRWNKKGFCTRQLIDKCKQPPLGKTEVMSQVNLSGRDSFSGRDLLQREMVPKHHPHWKNMIEWWQKKSYDAPWIHHLGGSSHKRAAQDLATKQHKFNQREIKKKNPSWGTCCKTTSKESSKYINVVKGRKAWRLC